MKSRYSGIGGSSVIIAVVVVAVLTAIGHATISHGDPTAQQAPDFQLADLGGTVHKLSDLRGKVVVLNFWASWCPECLIEIDSLSSFAEQYRKKGVVVLSISMDKNETVLRDFLQSHPVKFPVMVDREGDLYVRKYGIRGLPATIIVDRKGNLAAKMLGAQEFMSKEFTGKIDGLPGK